MVETDFFGTWWLSKGAIGEVKSMTKTVAAAIGFVVGSAFWGVILSPRTVSPIPPKQAPTNEQTTVTREVRSVTFLEAKVQEEVVQRQSPFKQEPVDPPLVDDRFQIEVPVEREEARSNRVEDLLPPQVNYSPADAVVKPNVGRVRILGLQEMWRHTQRGVRQR